MTIKEIKESLATQIMCMSVAELNSFLTINQSVLPRHKDMFDNWLREQFRKSDEKAIVGIVRHESNETSKESNKTSPTPESRSENPKISDNFGCQRNNPTKPD